MFWVCHVFIVKYSKTCITDDVAFLCEEKLDKALLFSKTFLKKYLTFSSEWCIIKNMEGGVIYVDRAWKIP